MDGSVGGLRLFAAEEPAPAPDPSGEAAPLPDPHLLAARELIRPPAARRGPREPEPFSAAWFDELGQKRYARHGHWLSKALEFGRHPGESVLLVGPGVGSDALEYLRHGTPVTVALGPDDHAELVRENLARHGFAARFGPVLGGRLPFPDGAFDVAVWNALHDPTADPRTLAGELFRVLKAGGKVIALFPAKYDAAYWQNLLLPLRRLYRRPPPDPTSAPKTTARDLCSAFGAFADHRTARRHLRRGELTHLWRPLPLGLLERLLGRVLVLKAFKPISAARPAAMPTPPPDSLAA